MLVLSKTGKVEKTLISNALKKIGSKNTREDFLEELLDDVEMTDENDALDKKNVSVTVSIDKKFNQVVHPDYSDIII